MVPKDVAAGALLTAMILMVSSCAGGEFPQENSSPATADDARAPGEPILGVSTPNDGEVPECAEPVVHRKEHVPTAEITVRGVAGDMFSYEVIKKNGPAETGEEEFDAGQRQAMFTTGIPNAEIDAIRISANGRVGTPGTCVIRNVD